MINRYKSKEGGTMIPLRFQNGGSNLFLRMPDGGTVGPMGNSPMGLPEYQTGTNFGGVNEKTMQDFDHYYSNGFPMMQEGGDPNAEQEEEEDTSFYSDRMNTFIQKIRDAAEKNLEKAVMEQDQEQPMAQYGMSMGSDPMNSYDPGNLNAYAKNSNYLNRLSQNAVSGYVQRMGALGPNDYYYKEKNIYRDKSKGAPLGTQTFTDASGMQSSISPAEAARRANAAYSKKDGGSLPKAQDGIAAAFDIIQNPELYRRAVQMGHTSVDDYKKSGWGYGKNHPQYKAPSYPSRVHINDPRTINATSGKPINPNVDLKSGDYHTGVIGEIARAAREYGINPQELMSMGLQESNLGKTDPNYGHVLNYRDPQNRGAAYDMAFARTEKNKVANEKGYANDELRRIQAYNGLGNVYPWTELDYHGKPMKSIYGVPLTNAGINMVDNPLYGKRIMDLRDNVLNNPQNAQYNQFLDKYNRDLANEEAVSQQQIGAYDIFNSFGSQYGNQFRDMMQGAYSDSLDNSAGTEYMYPEEGAGWPVPNLDNSRQRNALDRFNKGIGYEQIPYKKGGALKKYTGDEDASTTANNTANTTDKDKKPAPNGSEIIGTDNRNILYDGHNNSTNENTTVINGVRYAVDPVTREILGYNPQASTGTQNYNNYNPYGGYNPYGAYGSMRGRNLGVISKNRLTKDFRENMLAGSYGNPQLLGVSDIQTRRAMDPGNRIKSMTFSYGQPIPGGRTTVNQSAANNSTQTRNMPPAVPTVTSKVNPPALDPNDPRVISPGVKAAEDYTFRPWQNLQDLPAEGPINQNDGAGPRDIPSPDVTYDPFTSSYIPRYNTYPDLDNSGNVSPVNVMANNTAPNTDKNSNIAPATNLKGESSYSPELLNSNPPGTLVQGNDGRFYFQDANGEVHSSNDQNSITQKRNSMGLTGMKHGGSLHRFMRRYDDGGPFSSPQPGTTPVMDWSLPSAQEMMQNHMNSLYDNKLDLGVTDMFGKPMSHDFSTDKIDLGVKDLNGKPIVTDLSDLSRKMKNEDTNTAMGDGFDVETKSRKKKIRNPEKDLAAINFATNLANGRNAAYAKTDYGIRSLADRNFKPMRSTEGNYDILSGDFRRGNRNPDGNTAFHSGFNTYAQMGGNMMQNLKEGDDVYLTEDQINQIIKRGGKLSYL